VMEELGGKNPTKKIVLAEFFGRAPALATENLWPATRAEKKTAQKQETRINFGKIWGERGSGGRELTNLQRKLAGKTDVSKNNQLKKGGEGGGGNVRSQANKADRCSELRPGNLTGDSTGF